MKSENEQRDLNELPEISFADRLSRQVGFLVQDTGRSTGRGSRKSKKGCPRGRDYDNVKSETATLSDSPYNEPKRRLDVGLNENGSDQSRDIYTSASDNTEFINELMQYSDDEIRGLFLGLHEQIKSWCASFVPHALPELLHKYLCQLTERYPIILPGNTAAIVLEDPARRRLFLQGVIGQVLCKKIFPDWLPPQNKSVQAQGAYHPTSLEYWLDEPYAKSINTMYQGLVCAPSRPSSFPPPPPSPLRLPCSSAPSNLFRPLIFHS